MAHQPLNSHVQPIVTLLQGLLCLRLAETHALQANIGCPALTNSSFQVHASSWTSWHLIQHPGCHKQYLLPSCLTNLFHMSVPLDSCMLLYNCNHSEDVDATLHTEGISDLPAPHEFGWYHSHTRGKAGRIDALTCSWAMSASKAVSSASANAPLSSAPLPALFLVRLTFGLQSK